MKNAMYIPLLFMFLVSAAHAQTESAFVKDDDRYDRNLVRIWGSIGEFDYSLKGQGASISASDSHNVQYGVEGHFRSADFIWKLGYATSKAEFLPPSGNASALVQVFDRDLNFSVGSKLLGNAGSHFLADAVFNLGLFTRSRTADRSTPTEVVVDSNQGGLMLGLDLTRAINNDFTYHLETNFKFISSFTESPSRTGYFRSGYALDTRFSVMYPISRFVDLSAGMFFNYGKINFEGTGDRGFTNAAATEIRYGIPLEVLIFF